MILFIPYPDKLQMAPTIRGYTAAAQIRSKHCEIGKQRDLVYKNPCKNCEKTEIGEKGKLFQTKLEEHKKDVNNVQEIYMRTAGKLLAHTIKNSAIMDHVSKENHIIDWHGLSVRTRV